MCTKLKSIKDRVAFIKREKLCFKCLSRNHGIKECRNRKPCFFCKKDNANHHSSICYQCKSVNSLAVPGIEENTGIYDPKPRKPIDNDQ